MAFTWRNCCVIVPQRWVLAIMAFLGLLINTSMRSCLAIAIVDITNTSNLIPRNSSSNETMKGSDRRTTYYDWPEDTQGLILSSFYFGYFVTHLPGGILAKMLGGKYVLGGANLLGATMTILTPIIIETFDSTGLMVWRILLGLVSGPLLPSTHVLISKWAPPMERSSITTTITSGFAAGNVVSSLLSGVLISRSAIGWPCVFYVFGGCGIVWCLVWGLVCYSSPERHPFISAKEKKYLHDTMHEHTHKEALPTPWKPLMSSVPVWSMAAAWCAADWGLLVVALDLPKYMSSVLGFDIESNGFLTAIPNLGAWITGMTASCLIDWIIAKNLLSRTVTRKMFSFIAVASLATCLVTASYMEYDRGVVVVLLTVGMSVMALTSPSIKTTPLDLSPNFSGVLLAFANGMGAISGAAAPYAIGILAPNQTLSEWRLVFWITAAILMTGNMAYLIGGDNEVQSWNDPDYLNEDFGSRKNATDRKCDAKNSGR